MLDELYTGPVDLLNNPMALGVIHNKYDGIDKFEDELMEWDHSFRSGNIPHDSWVFFDGSIRYHVNKDECSVYVTVFVEGNTGISLERL